MPPGYRAARSWGCRTERVERPFRRVQQLLCVGDVGTLNLDFQVVLQRRFDAFLQRQFASGRADAHTLLVQALFCLRKRGQQGAEQQHSDRLSRRPPPAEQPAQALQNSPVRHVIEQAVGNRSHEQREQ